MKIKKIVLLLVLIISGSSSVFSKETGEKMLNWPYYLNYSVKMQSCNIVYEFAYSDGYIGSNPDEDVLSISWNFGDGTTETIEGVNVLTVQHAYEISGNYNVTATVTKRTGNIIPMSLNIDAVRKDYYSAAIHMITHEGSGLYSVKLFKPEFGNYSITVEFGDGATYTSLSSEIPYQEYVLITHQYLTSGNTSIKISLSNTSSNGSISSVCNISSQALYVATVIDDNVNPCDQFIETADFSYEENNGIYSFYIQNEYLDNITSLTMDFGDGTQYVVSSPIPNYEIGSLITTHSYTSPGEYTIELIICVKMAAVNEHCCPNKTMTLAVPVDDGGGDDESDCCINFAPQVGQRYWLSAWVKEDRTTLPMTYSNLYVGVSFDESATIAYTFYPTGNIIDGWQRVIGEFKVPMNASNFELILGNNDESIGAYFDDIRVHPFNSSMKSYVYDPETLWLTSELDDNNYATFYEYDKEGQLIRIKKETARGVMTIQESRTRTQKSETSQPE
jgi:hypothetical protein